MSLHQKRVLVAMLFAPAIIYLSVLLGRIAWAFAVVYSGMP